MPNFPGPYEIEFELSGWLSPARSHVMRFNVVVVGSPAPGTAATLIDVQKTGGATAKLNVVANQMWEYLRLAYNTSISCTSYTLWKYVSGTHSKDFITSGTLTNPAGVVVGSPPIAHQVTLTFRSVNSGILKVVYLESASTGENRTLLVPNPAGTPYQRFAAYIMSADNVALARDDGYPVAPLRDSRGQNERIWREIFR